MIRPLLRTLAIIFFGVVLLTFWTQSLTQKNGPWVLTYRSTASQMGTATISNKRLGIGDIVLTFKIISPSTLPNVEVKLDGDKAALPYGTITEIDTTVLPGYVRLQINNSDLKIMERTLIIDGIEHPWSSVPKEALLLH